MRALFEFKMTITLSKRLKDMKSVVLVPEMLSNGLSGLRNQCRRQCESKCNMRSNLLPLELWMSGF